MKATLLERPEVSTLWTDSWGEGGTVPVFEEPDGDHSEGEEEGVEQQGETVKLVKDRLLLIVGDIWGQGRARV